MDPRRPSSRAPAYDEGSSPAGARDDSDLSTLLQHRFVRSPMPAGAFQLTVIAGPDSAASVTLDGSNPSPLLIGQGPACDIRLSDPEVSRRHAALEIVGDRLRVSDLGSKNGTLIDHVPIVEAFLLGGESLRVGGTVFRVERRALSAQPRLPVAAGFGRVIGASNEMRRLYPVCERAAATDVPIIIEGETGTGKEILAESLHEQGPRAGGPFVVFDCTAVPPNLVESELFGHERGAFTGAVATRKGFFEQAHGGTLFVDEIGDLQPALQPKLLRAIERSEVRRIGGDHPIRFDVRILAATRRDLDHEVQAGRFRDDLFHRLAVGRIELPPLRRRKGDIPLLAQHFSAQLGGDARSLPADLLARWDDSPWPGNVRELRNAVARFLALGDAQQRVAAGAAVAEGASDFIETVLAMKLTVVAARERVIEEFERRYIERILADHGGSVARAAEASGIARRHFNRLKARAAK